MLQGPGTWGVNLGIHKDFHFGGTLDGARSGQILITSSTIHCFRLDADNGGGGGTFALLGDFNLGVDPGDGVTPATFKPVIADVTRNEDFGKLLQTFSQEGIDNHASRCVLRLKVLSRTLQSGRPFRTDGAAFSSEPANGFALIFLLIFI